MALAKNQVIVMHLVPEHDANYELALNMLVAEAVNLTSCWIFSASPPGLP